MRCIIYIRASDIYNDSRAIKEIQCLLDGGYDIFLLGWNKSLNAQDKAIRIFGNKNIRYRFYVSNNKKNNLGDKIMDRIQWIKWIKLNVKEIIKNNVINIIHACDFDTGIAIPSIIKKSKIRFVYDIYDYYAASHNLHGAMKKIVSSMEDRVINSSDLTIICTYERKIQIKNSNPKKVIVIFNSPDIEKLEEKIKKYDYAYCGVLDNSRLIGNIINEYDNHSYLTFAFAGVGSLMENVNYISSTHSNFYYEGSITYNKVLEIESEAKVLSAIYDPKVENHKLCAPNKFYEALALGKPIIVCEGTGIDKVVRDEKIGIVIHYDVEEFYDALKYLVDNPDICKNMGLRARKIYEKKYRWSNSKKILLNSYDDLLCEK